MIATANRTAPTWVFTGIACALSSVTAVSVALAMFALIDDPILAALFAGAAVLLDVYKYLAWPLALSTLLGRRFAAATLLALTALALAGVSGWATYDRLMHSIVGSRAEHQAIQVQRMFLLRLRPSFAVGTLSCFAGLAHRSQVLLGLAIADDDFLLFRALHN